MSLSTRDRVKVMAGLTLMHDAGMDTGEVTRVAETLINSGTPASKAYSTAFGKLFAAAPQMAAPILRLEQLVDATDNRTIASYSLGLSRYIETGERGHLDAILPTIQQDMADMAVRTGDAGFVDGLGSLPAAPSEKPAQAPAEALGASPVPSRPGWGPMGYSAAAAAQEAGE